MLRLSRGAAVVGWVWIGGALLGGCGGNSVSEPDGEADAPNQTTGGTGGSSSVGSGGTGGTGGTGATGTGAASGTSSTGGTGAVGGASAGADAGGSNATAGSNSGAAAGTGGTPPSSGGAGAGAASGNAGAAGALPNFTSCAEVRAAYDAELDSIQACTVSADCGQPLVGTSCGCTRDRVARLDADTTRFQELRRTQIDGESCIQNISTCECPNADGFVCHEGYCGWNYVSREPPQTCSSATIGTLCVVGEPNEAGEEQLIAGNPLLIQLLPAGCFSSSCSELKQPTCAIQSLGDNQFVANAVLQVCQFGDGRECTEDCAGPEPKTCDPSSISNPLGEGTHEVTLRGTFDTTLRFEVPSTIPPGGLCVSVPFPE